jgi:hypothetical protein
VIGNIWLRAREGSMNFYIIRISLVGSQVLCLFVASGVDGLLIVYSELSNERIEVDVQVGMLCQIVVDVPHEMNVAWLFV